MGIVRNPQRAVVGSNEMMHMKLLALCCDSSVIQKKNLYPVPSVDDVSFHKLCPGAWHPVDVLVLLWRVSYSQSPLIGQC